MPTYSNDAFDPDDIVKVGEVYMPRSKAVGADSQAEPAVRAADLTDTTVKMLNFLALQKKGYDSFPLDDMTGGGKTAAKKPSAKKPAAKKPAPKKK
jgi:hypothetical protein